jgi:hypothetical protein
VLSKAVRNLETAWRSKSSQQPPPILREENRIQYYILDTSTVRVDTPELIVTVGMSLNGSKLPISLPDLVGTSWRQRASLAARIVRSFEHLSDNYPAWQREGIVGDPGSMGTLPRKFHIILAGLSPWIPMEYWSGDLFEEHPARGGRLLAQPPFVPTQQFQPFDHLADLQNEMHRLGLEPFWVAHGFNSVGVLWPTVAAALGIRRWIVTGNLFSRRFKAGPPCHRR